MFFPSNPSPISAAEPASVSQSVGHHGIFIVNFSLQPLRL
jgi:hypothetical protein